MKNVVSHADVNRISSGVRPAQWSESSFENGQGSIPGAHRIQHSASQQPVKSRPLLRQQKLMSFDLLWCLQCPNGVNFDPAKTIKGEAIKAPLLKQDLIASSRDPKKGLSDALQSLSELCQLPPVQKTQFRGSLL